MDFLANLSISTLSLTMRLIILTNISTFITTQSKSITTGEQIDTQKLLILQ